MFAIAASARNTLLITHDLERLFLCTGSPKLRSGDVDRIRWLQPEDSDRVNDRQKLDSPTVAKRLDLLLAIRDRLPD
jgi:hypothetical protein